MCMFQLKEATLHLFMWNIYNFSFPQHAYPGVTTLGLGHVKIEVNAAVPGLNASQDSRVREHTLSLSDPSKSAVESIFLSPL